MYTNVKDKNALEMSRFLQKCPANVLHISRTCIGHFPNISRRFPQHVQDIYQTFPGNLLQMSWTCPGHLSENSWTFGSMFFLVFASLSASCSFCCILCFWHCGTWIAEFRPQNPSPGREFNAESDFRVKTRTFWRPGAKN